MQLIRVLQHVLVAQAAEGDGCSHQLAGRRAAFAQLSQLLRGCRLGSAQRVSALHGWQASHLGSCMCCQLPAMGSLSAKLVAS